MISHAPDFNRGRFELVKSTREIGVHSLAQFVVDQEWETVFG